VEFGLLGPLEARVEGAPLPLGAAKQRALLAVLLIYRNQVVSTDRLVDEIWGDEPPGTAANVLQVYVSQLRKVLEPGRAPGEPSRTLLTQPPGYVLRIDHESVDVDRFQRLLDEGRRRLAAGDPSGAGRVLTAGLALWRGDPLADFTYAPFAQAEIARLAELRIGALEDRIDADLARGGHGSLVGELEALVSRHPLRERLRAQLILGLYRSGRQADALAAYQETRTILVEELGIDPSPSLQHLEKAILVQDPSLELELPPPGPEPQALPRGEPAVPGPAVVEPTQVRDLRKTVTVVFSDLVDSTSLGDRLDPEVLGKVMSRYFETVSAVLERHGGTVEKFIGDAVMAVFGVPTIHEDDALRALRATIEIRREVETLNGELEARWGARLAVRTGVNTGEVVVGLRGSGHPLVVGGAVNVAARLEQLAAPDQILVGDETWRLARDAVQAEQLEDVAVKGKSAPIRVWLLHDVVPDRLGVGRRLDNRLVGRELELAQLHQAFERSLREERAHLYTILGAAGIGKSRLAGELAASLDGRAQILTGRCLPYGKGITFWPIAEIIRDALGDEPRDGILELVGAEEGRRIAELVEAVIGRGVATAATAETFWAARTLLAQLASRTPLVVILEDVHWAEPTLLDLVEHLAEWTRAPLLLLCLARPELLDDRPGWAGGKLNATSTLLAPLSAPESDELMDELLGDLALAPSARAAIGAAAEGNPLFVEQMLALLAERGPGEREPEVPPTIQALLAARLDRLGPAERAVVEAASVIGKEFWLAAVEELVPPGARESVETHLRALVRRELLRPDRSQLAGQDAYSFGHILIRDIAYRAIPKEVRARLHEQFAGWLGRVVGEHQTEYEEILGYHLEQAFRHRTELSPAGEADHELAARAGALLAAGGRRAVSRGDMSSGVNLLGRAHSLLPTDAPGRSGETLELAYALSAVGEIGRARGLLEELVEAARAAGDARLETLAALEHLQLETLTDPAFDTGRLIAAAESAVPVFESAGDEQGLARAWLTVAEAHLTNCRWGLSTEALEQGLPHARRAGTKELVLVLTHLANSLYWGPTPVTAAMARCDDLLELGTGHRIVEANMLCYLGGLLAMQGRFAESQEHLSRGRAVFEELGHAYGVAASTLVAGPARLLAGEAAQAEALLRAAWATLEAMGETAILSSVTAFLAEALYEQGRFAEVEEVSRISELASADDDEASQIGWRTARAKALARRGELDQAEQLAREAVERAARTDFLTMHGDALLSLAKVLEGGGDAERLVAEAVELYERKGNAAAARRARSDFALAEASGGASV
jgi:class 3 adenylate cyclase/DNA-binding SARP family transcriptional activator/tetratricopeptide (TPR) repeat protein